MNIIVIYALLFFENICYTLAFKNIETIILLRNSRHILNCPHDKNTTINSLHWYYQSPRITQTNPLPEIHNSYYIGSKIKIIQYKEWFTDNDDNPQYISFYRKTNFTQHYNMVTDKYGSINLVIKNASITTAGNYYCNINNITPYFVISVIVLLNKPFIEETIINTNFSKICCIINYRGDIPPLLEFINDINSTKTNILNENVKVCSNVIRNSNTIYRCILKSNITTTNLNFSIISEDFVLSNEENLPKVNNKDTICKVTIVLLLVESILLVIIILRINIKKYKNQSSIKYIKLNEENTN